MPTSRAAGCLTRLGCFIPVLIVVSAAPAQLATDTTRRGIPRFTLEFSGPAASGPARAGAFIADVGARAALVATETGRAEAWLWPERVLSSIELAFTTPASPAKLDASALARSVTAQPEAATVVYVHPAFTVRQHMFVPLGEAGAIVLLDVETDTPLDIHVGIQSDFATAWLAAERRFELTRSGARPYVGLVGSPSARGDAAAGELVLRIDPAGAAAEYAVIVIAGAATRDSAAATYHALLTNVAARWRTKAAHYGRLQRDLFSIEADDPQLADGVAWSIVDLDQRTACAAIRECPFVTDAATNAAAAGAIGYFERARQLLERMHIDRQTDREGTAPPLPEALPLWLIAWQQYVNTAGDVARLERYWPAVTRAFRESAESDEDGDGLAEIRSMVGPGVSDRITDVQLGGVWVAAIDAMNQLAQMQEDAGTAGQAALLAERAHAALEAAFWVDSAGIYASALREDSAARRHADAQLTSLPAAAIAAAVLDVARSGRTLEQMASSNLTADWGVRGLPSTATAYDSLDYSNGAVSPAMTSTLARAHYQHHRSWSGFDLLRDVARATFDFARGRAPVLLSGAGYRAIDAHPLRNSTSSAAFLTAVVRGLVGWQADATRRAAAFEPHLPAEWSGLKVSNLPLGRDRIEATLVREAGRYTINLRRLTAGPPITVLVSPALPLGARIELVVVKDANVPIQVEESAHDLHVLAEVKLDSDAQIEIHYQGGLEVIPPDQDLAAAPAASPLRVLALKRSGRDYVVEVEGHAGASHALELRSQGRIRTVQGSDGFEQKGERIVIRLTMPVGTGVARKTLRIRA